MKSIKKSFLLALAMVVGSAPLMVLPADLQIAAEQPVAPMRALTQEEQESISRTLWRLALKGKLDEAELSVLRNYFRVSNVIFKVSLGLLTAAAGVGVIIAASKLKNNFSHYDLFRVSLPTALACFFGMTYYDYNKMASGIIETQKGIQSAKEFMDQEIPAINNDSADVFSTDCVECDKEAMSAKA